MTPVGLLFFALVHQSISSEAGLSPTSSTKTINAEDLTTELQRTSGTTLRDYGGPASVQSLGIRSSDAKDVTVTLEGVPLNSTSAGTFDLGLLNPYGLGSAEIIRGSYTPAGTAAGGTLALRLPREERYRLTIGRGTENYLFIGHELPFGTITYDQADNDFPYHLNGVELNRQHNRHHRFNARGWIRKENWQVWGQLLFVDLDMPGPSFSPDASNMKTIQPTAAFQYRGSDWQTSLRAQFQNQDIQGAGTNRWYSGGFNFSKRFSLASWFNLETLFDQSLDRLSSDSFHSDLRSTTAIVTTGYWEPYKQHIISPRLRFETVSDLSQKFTAMPGLGGKHPLGDNTFLIWNLQYLSRAPNFNEMYFVIPNVYDPNPNLHRETAINFDIGYSHRQEKFRIEQNLYAQRKNNLMETITYSSGKSQVQNTGSSRALGIETDIHVVVVKDIELDIQHAIQKTDVSSVQTSLLSPRLKGDTRRQFYQPFQKLSFIPTFFGTRKASLSIPIYYKTRVSVNQAGQSVAPQWDLGFELKTQPVKIFLPLEFKLRARNLLYWDREETFGYPLSSQPSIEAYLTALF